MERYYFDMLWLFARPGHKNFHNALFFFNVKVAQDPKIHLQENEYLGESAEWLKDINKSSHFFFFLCLISKNEATSMRVFFNPSTVIYTQNKFR